MNLSDFLTTSQNLPAIPSDYKKCAEWEENNFFNAWIQQYPKNEHDNIKEQLEYIRLYALQFPEFDGDEWSFSQAAMNYYDERLLRIKDSRLSEKEFYDFEILQESIKELGLSPKATFEFIVFIWHQLVKWLNGSIGELIANRIKRASGLIDDNPNDELELDIKVGKKHFTFTNSNFVKSVVALISTTNLWTLGQVELIHPKKREIDYILIYTLLQNLPINYQKHKKGKFTQAERNFGLSVLWLTGEINHKRNDDPVEFCTQYNNATFDKLMRDYKDLHLPILLPLF